MNAVASQREEPADGRFPRRGTHAVHSLSQLCGSRAEPVLETIAKPRLNRA